MKYRTFFRLGIMALVLIFIGAGVLITLGIRLARRNASKTAVVSTSEPTPSPTPSTAAPITLPAPAPTQASVNAANSPQRATTNELKQKLSLWLDQHPDRQDMMKSTDILPQESFSATAIRFPPADAVKWASKDSQWSQIRIDLDRDGQDDEKWLLKDGHIYKREVLDSLGNATFTEYFK